MSVRSSYLGVQKNSTEAVQGFACPTCDVKAGEPCLSMAANPQDKLGRHVEHPYALDLPHRKRMALRKSAHALELAGLSADDLLRFSAQLIDT